MKIQAFLLLVTMTAASETYGMTVPGATENGIIHDCQVTAELSVMLLKKKAKSAPDQLVQAAVKLLNDRKYQGSFGNGEFIANFYTGMALEMGAEVDPAMAAATPDELESLLTEHETACLQKALEELPPQPVQPAPSK